MTACGPASPECATPPQVLLQRQQSSVSGRNLLYVVHTAGMLLFERCPIRGCDMRAGKPLEGDKLQAEVASLIVGGLDTTAQTCSFTM